jgi:hypothetical protein
MLHDADAEPPHNKAHNEQQEESLKQILLTVLNPNRQRCHAENLHRSHQRKHLHRSHHRQLGTPIHRPHHHRLGTLLQDKVSPEALQTPVQSAMLSTDSVIFAVYQKKHIGVNQTSLKDKKKKN